MSAGVELVGTEAGGVDEEAGGVEEEAGGRAGMTSVYCAPHLEHWYTREPSTPTWAGVSLTRMLKSCSPVAGTASVYVAPHLVHLKVLTPAAPHVGWVVMVPPS